MARRSGIKSFAQLAVENGLASEEQMAECLSIQEQAKENGEDTGEIEQIILDRGFMTDQEVRAIKTALGRLARDEKRGEVVRIGGYEITGTLGDGGLGTVYRARQVSMGRDVALKVLHKKWLTDEEFKKRFLLEARLVGRLSHQYLIQVFEVG
jgi:serine/threonine protein kinase